MNYIAAYIGSNDELRFFCRMSKELKKKNYRFIFISNKISILLKSFLKGEITYAVKKTNLQKTSPEVLNCHDFVTGKLNFQSVVTLYSSVYYALDKVINKHSPEIVFIWNGLSVQSLAVSDLCKVRHIKTRFFELSNIPGKVFVNPFGVNARSGLYSNPAVLDSYTVKKEDYKLWKEGYALDKINQSMPKSAKKKNFLFLLDILAFRFLNFPRNGDTSIVKKIKELFQPGSNISYDEYNFISGKYIFLPLQVNSDTQLLFNSNINNLEAIKIGLSKARDRGIDLLVKIHPFEDEYDFIEKILQLRKSEKFYLVNYSSIELIINAALVITINSTAGLESMIFNKDVEFLGKSFYPHLTGSRLINYICGYLVNVDYWSDQVFDNESVDRILSIR